MDDAFQKLMQQKNNSVDTCVMWFQSSQIIDFSREAEEKARQLFAEVKDKQNVELEKFKEAVCKLAEGQKKTLEDISRKLAEHGPRVLDAVVAGASAFKDAFTK